MTDAIETSGSLSDRIEALVRQGKVELPPFPDLAVRLQQRITSDDVEAAEIAEMVSNEPALVSSLLRVANSAAFGGLRPIEEIRQAIARLGMTQVGSIASALLVKDHFVSRPGDRALTQTLWDHSVTTAFAAKELAERIGADQSQAFLAALLHDCGISLVLNAVHLLRKEGLDVDPTEALMDDLMKTLHCRLGHAAMETWQLPEVVGRVVLHHEDPAEDSEDPILLCVQAADLITRKLGFDLDPDPDLPLLQEPAIESLGIDDLALASLMVDLEDRLEELRQLL